MTIIYMAFLNFKMFKKFKITLLNLVNYVNDCVHFLQITHLKLITQHKM